jgi:hypothetical protein
MEMKIIKKFLLFNKSIFIIFLLFIKVLFSYDILFILKYKNKFFLKMYAFWNIIIFLYFRYLSSSLLFEESTLN